MSASLTACDSCTWPLPLSTGRQRCPRCGSWVDGQFITIAPGTTVPPIEELDDGGAPEEGGRHA